MAEGKDAPLEEAKSELERMYNAGVQAVLPATIINNSVCVTGKELRISDKSYNLDENIYLVGFGKAVMGMALALEEKLGAHLRRGIVSVPHGSAEKLRRMRDRSAVVDFRESSVANQPDSETLRITLEIVDLAENLKKDDTLIVLISGGGSALLCLPRPTIRWEDKLELCKRLQNSGADIKELNTVRKKLSVVKGGGLARKAHPARVVALILSDIVGDPVDLVASGPTVHSEKSPEEVASILRKYSLYEGIDGDLKILLNSEEARDDESLLNEQGEFRHVDNFIIGNNILAIEAARQEALRTGLSPICLRIDVVGRVERVSEAYARIARLLCRAWNKSIDEETFFQSVKNDSVISLNGKKVREIFSLLENYSGRGIVLIGAGEPTVVVKGSGKGGRNQELALRFSQRWFESIRDDTRLAEFEVTFLSAGTDGQDGPTDAAGAFGYPYIEPITSALLKKLQRLCNTDNIAEENCLRTEGARVSEGQDENLSFSGKTNLFQSMLREAEKMVPQTVLANNDSYNFYSRFRRGKDLLKTGISGTNVMDLHFVLVKKRRCGSSIFSDCAIESSNLLEEHDLRSNLDDPQIKPNPT